ncbi:MAG: hypothetical protein ACYTBR_12765 [Planctomycetota bacterium]
MTVSVAPQPPGAVGQIALLHPVGLRPVGQRRQAVEQELALDLQR